MHNVVHITANCSPATLIHDQRGWEDKAADPETKDGGQQEEQRVSVPGRAQRGDPGHHEGLEQGGRECGEPLRHQGELGTRDNGQSGYLMPSRLTWSSSSHSGTLITHFPIIDFRNRI